MLRGPGLVGCVSGCLARKELRKAESLSLTYIFAAHAYLGLVARGLHDGDGWSNQIKSNQIHLYYPQSYKTTMEIVFFVPSAASI